VPIIELVVNAKSAGKEETLTKKNFVGFIRGLESSQVLLDCDGLIYKLALTNIEKARLNPVF